MSGQTHDRYQQTSTSGCLLHNNRALLIRRGPRASFLPGYYELPGGKVDFGEEPEEALRREFMEETGLRITVERPFRVCSYLLEDGKRHNIEIIYAVSLENPALDTVQLSSEHDDAQWFGKEEALTRTDISKQVKESIHIIFQKGATSHD